MHAANPTPPHALLTRAGQAALVESRERWRHLVGLAADFVFETDAAGRLEFIAPEVVLGWPAGALLGHHPAEAGLLRRGDPDPLALRRTARDLRVWAQRADGSDACLSLSVAPRHDPHGIFAGLRGSARDITEAVAETEAQATALRRALAVQALVRRVREAVLAPRMLPTLLDLLPSAVGCIGATLVTIDAAAGRLRTASADPRLPGLPDRLALPWHPNRPVFLLGSLGEPVALVPQAAFSALDAGAEPEALMVWRGAGDRAFDADERHLLQALSDLLGVVLGNQRLLAELERQARTDGMTGLLNRRTFLEELRRRQDRQGGNTQGGALVFLDVDNLKQANDQLGHATGDALLLAVAQLLRGAARSVDLAARLGGDEFALWLDGVTDQGVACDRAAALCANAATIEIKSPQDGRTVPVGVSIGIAMASPADAGAGPEALLARADSALYAAKRAGRNAWRLASSA